MRAHAAADDAQMLAEDHAQVQRDLRAAGVANDEDAAAVPCNAQAVRHGGAADVVYHHVHALSVGQLPDCARPGRRIRATDDLICAKRQCRLAALLCAADNQHLRAGQFGNLDAGRVDAAARADDEHRLARAQAAARQQRMPGGDVDQTGRRRVLVAHVAGHLKQVVRGHDGEFRCCARQLLAQNLQPPLVLKTAAPRRIVVGNDGRIDADARTRWQAADASPAKIDFTGAVRGDDMRHVQFQAGPAGTHPQVEAVEGNGAHSQPHFARPWLRPRQVAHVGQSLRPAMRLQYGRAHQRSPSTLRAMTRRWISLLPS